MTETGVVRFRRTKHAVNLAGAVCVCPAGVLRFSGGSAMKFGRRRGGIAGCCALAVLGIGALAHAGTGHSPARQWNEELLEAIRKDFARPTVHARNLFHTAIVTWDAWAAYEPLVDGYLTDESLVPVDVELARAESISFACYRLLKHRFANSPGAALTLPALDARMASMVVEFGFENDASFTSTDGDSPAALGNRIAQAMIGFGLVDHSNEQIDYANLYYAPVNAALVPDFPGNPNISDLNRWQPLALQYFIDQSGNPIPFGFPPFLSPEWGQVYAFALQPEDRTIYQRGGFDYWVFHDPGAPPLHGAEGDDYYKWGTEMVVTWSGHCDPSDGVMWDISPASLGNSPLADPDDYALLYDRLSGGDWGQGYDLNPVTGQPYTPQIVPRGDYVRVLAEFWADGPDSETPPGHWFTILNYVSDHPLFAKRLGGEGPILNDLEWDVKAYLALGATMHDSAVSAWGVKGWYDYIRPVSAIRALADFGQSSDPMLPSYDERGIRLIPGHIEVVSAQTTAMGERHEHLAGSEGKIAVRAWRGPDYIANPATDVAGVGWILAENWWPYQRPTFVTPPFAGYVSGHSVYSRAAAELMTLLTGSPWFPGGLGEFHCPQNEFLVFEEGPSVDLTLQWASYRDASDQTSLSRIWGGIHPPADDLPGRHMGVDIAFDAYDLARLYFAGVADNRYDIANNDDVVDYDDLVALINAWRAADPIADFNGDGLVGFGDVTMLLRNWGATG